MDESVRPISRNAQRLLKAICNANDARVSSDWGDAVRYTMVGAPVGLALRQTAAAGVELENAGYIVTNKYNLALLRPAAAAWFAALPPPPEKKRRKPRQS